jgi:hypothetical protein
MTCRMRNDKLRDLFNYFTQGCPKATLKSDLAYGGQPKIAFVEANRQHASLHPCALRQRRCLTAARSGSLV